MLYGSGTRRTTNQTTKRLQTFTNHYLRRIMQKRWIDEVRNKDLWQSTKQEPVKIHEKEENGAG